MSLGRLLCCNRSSCCRAVPFERTSFFLGIPVHRFVMPCIQAEILPPHDRHRTASPSSARSRTRQMHTLPNCPRSDSALQNARACPQMSRGLRIRGLRFELPIRASSALLDVAKGVLCELLAGGLAIAIANTNPAQQLAPHLAKGNCHTAVQANPPRRVGVLL